MSWRIPNREPAVSMSCATIRIRRRGTVIARFSISPWIQVDPPNWRDLTRMIRTGSPASSISLTLAASLIWPGRPSQSSATVSPSLSTIFSSARAKSACGTCRNCSSIAGLVTAGPSQPFSASPRPQPVMAMNGVAVCAERSVAFATSAPVVAT
jgi:hypothetical protein